MRPDGKHKCFILRADQNETILLACSDQNVLHIAELEKSLPAHWSRGDPQMRPDGKTNGAVCDNAKINHLCLHVRTNMSGHIA